MLPITLLDESSQANITGYWTQFVTIRRRMACNTLALQPCRVSRIRSIASRSVALTYGHQSNPAVQHVKAQVAMHTQSLRFELLHRFGTAASGPDMRGRSSTMYG